MTETTTHLNLALELERAWPRTLRNAHPIVVAVSGGPDSMVLLHLLAADRAAHLHVAHLHVAHLHVAHLHVAHVHHGLRGAESDRDADCVKRACQRLKLPFHLMRVDASDGRNGAGEGIEGRARRLRYDALRKVARETGARTIATAHTRDDQVETVLHRIIRGTGVSGLAAMPMFRELETGLSLARPLLNCGRAEIEDYVAEFELETVVDSSNASDEFTRNRLRNELLPWLREHLNPKVDEALLRLSSIAADYDGILQSQVDSLLTEANLQVDDTTITMDRQRLVQESPLVARSALRTIWRQAGWPERRMGRDQWIQMTDFLFETEPAFAPAKRSMLPYDIEMSIQGEQFVLTDLAALEAELQEM